MLLQAGDGSREMDALGSSVAYLARTVSLPSDMETNTPPRGDILIPSW